jgi:predicted DNA-binding mobile mystery protein A
MIDRKRRLILDQVSTKLEPYAELAGIPPQPTGWINTIRTALGMSLAQLGERADKSAQGVRALEQREKSGAITLQLLREMAEALDMELVYAFVPRKGTLKQMVDEKAEEKAREIVMRIHASMTLEDQQLNSARLMEMIKEKKEELISELPKFLWD